MKRVALQFDEPAHVYRVEGRRVPNVTSILEPVSGLAGIPPNVLEYSRALGKATHKATELDDLGRLEESSVEPDVMLRLESWRAFRGAYAFEPELIECRVYHQNYGYAGTFDRVGSLTMPIGMRARRRLRVLLDLKSGVPLPCHDLQLSAYRHASIVSSSWRFISGRARSKSRGARSPSKRSAFFFRFSTFTDGDCSMPEAQSPQDGRQPPIVNLPAPALDADSSRGAAEFLERAQGMTISSEMEFVSATEFARECKSRRGALDKTRKGFTDPLTKLIGDWTAVFRPAIDRYASAEEIARNKFTAYRNEQDRAARIKQAAQDEAARKERERLAKLAQKQAAKGKVEQAEASLELARSIPERSIAPPPPQAAGTSFRVTWSCVIDSEFALLLYIVEHPEHLPLVTFDQSALDKLAATYKEQLTLPGAHAESKTISVLRS